MSHNNFEEFNNNELPSLGTTAIEAQMNAPNEEEARHVSENVERAKDAANQAASVAKTLGSGEPATAVDQLKTDASRTTEAAVSEGRRDVQQAKAIGTGYVEQARSVANSALETAQNYLPAALGGKPVEPEVPTREAPNMVDQVAHTAADFYATAVSAAQPPIDKLRGAVSVMTDAAQPHVEDAKKTAQSTSGVVHSQIETATSVAKPHLENAKYSTQTVVDSALSTTKAKVQGSMGAADHPLTGQKGDIPSTTTPLESGPHTVKSPYPATTAQSLAKDSTRN